MNNTSRPHDEAVVELLREDPTFVDEYLAAAMKQANQDGGREALLAALRHVAEAQVYDQIMKTVVLILSFNI